MSALAADAVRRPRVGLLGGSFDPVHRTHLALALAAQAALNLDQVQFIPAAQPWQRQPLQASTAQRLEMLRLTLAGHAGLSINRSEIERGGQTYTVDTVVQLPPGPQYFWILGTDQLRNFCSWHAWDTIVQHVELAVAQRPGSALQAPAALHDWLQRAGRALTQIPFMPRDASASDIRARCAAGLPIDDQVVPAVADYIHQHQLYRGASGPQTTPVAP